MASSQEGFCDCTFPPTTCLTNFLGNIHDLVGCRCGETAEDGSCFKQWMWAEKDGTDARIYGPDIVFHPTFSQGTAVVRANRALSAKKVHFWEIRVLTVLSGTDVVFGIGTDKFDLDEYNFRFVSAVGINAESWGYSFSGKTYHKSESKEYGSKIAQGCIVGILVDRIEGYIEFYLNRRSMGIAYRNIPTDPNVLLYPMVSSTSARSAIHLMNSTSVPESLMLHSFKALSKNPVGLAELRSMSSIKHIAKDFWFYAQPIRYSRESPDNRLDIADEAVISTKASSNKRRRKEAFIDEVTDINDLYTNAHKITLKEDDSDDEDYAVEDLFDEYFQYLF